MKNQIQHVTENEDGIILITALVLLVVLTLIGIGAMQSSTMQERMAGNMEQRDIAFQMAEAGLREAEEFFITNVLPDFGTGGVYIAGNAPARWWEGSGNSAGADSGARYIIEFVTEISTGSSSSNSMAFAPVSFDAAMYRITSRAESGRAVVMLQTTFQF
ncbi:type IV pilus assembly protein PilX [Desulfobotulus alkaliphilus]|uniref:Type IV pilus assembly protein PilX n=1 Tax=Desulfobotulus alkaliphilus TaxID=622671 RepID=A0A562RS83_9BACT|nr:PilX N-terminal domain-containing pilus assembly protein [Desulfobotulus alkaliphilus]TWI71813.1 type IV pilus assembly protein PilX [Desulfobotulus alkaliphilus]